MVVACQTPEIFLIGSAKSGTTALAQQMDLHPEIFLGSLKEPEFFSHEDKWSLGWEWYLGLYRHAREGQKCLDASTGYTRSPQFPNAARRIYESRPDARLIYVMRHPIERAYSHFIHRHTREIMPGKPFQMTFSEFVKQDLMCLDSSNYQMQIEAYLKWFSRDALLLLRTDDLRSDPVGTLETIFQFVGVDACLADSLVGDRPIHANQTDNFLDSRINTDMSNRIKRIPGATGLMKVVPGKVRKSALNIATSSSIGRRSREAFAPPDLSSAERESLLEYFNPMVDWLESEMGVKLDAWRR